MAKKGSAEGPVRVLRFTHLVTEDCGARPCSRQGLLHHEKNTGLGAGGLISDRTLRSHITSAEPKFHWWVWRWALPHPLELWCRGLVSPFRPPTSRGRPRL